MIRLLVTGVNVCIKLGVSIFIYLFFNKKNNSLNIIVGKAQIAKRRFPTTVTNLKTLPLVYGIILLDVKDLSSYNNFRPWLKKLSFLLCTCYYKKQIVFIFFFFKMCMHFIESLFRIALILFQNIYWFEVFG